MNLVQMYLLQVCIHKTKHFSLCMSPHSERKHASEQTNRLREAKVLADEFKASFVDLCHYHCISELFILLLVKGRSLNKSYRKADVRW